MALTGGAAQSEPEAMADLVEQMWKRYIRPKVMGELMRHSLSGYKAKVVSNNGDGTLTVIRPYDTQTLTLRCTPGMVSFAAQGDQVLVVSLGDMSNSFVLCATNMDGFESIVLSNSDPLMDSADADPGTSENASRADHRHPSDSGKQNKITADGILKGDGNGSVTAAAAGVDYQAPLTIDDAPMSGSTNPVESGGVYVALEGKADVSDIPAPYASDPAMDGVASAGSSAAWSRGDHVHPSDTSRVPTTRKVNGKALSSDVTLDKSDIGLGNVDNVQQYSASNPPPYPVTSVNGNTGAVTVSVPPIAASTPSMDGTGSAGSTGNVSDAGHVHPTDTSRQEKITASGILKGDGNGGVSAAVSGTDYQAPLTAGTDYATPAMIPSVPAPSDATPQDLGTAAAGSSSDYSRADHVHKKPTYSKTDVGLGNVDNVQQFSASHLPSAADVTYDGTNSGLSAADVQEAIDALAPPPPASITAGTITLGTSWTSTGETQRWQQTVTVTGATVTENSLISLQLTGQQIWNMLADGVAALLIRNNGGVLTALAVGGTTSTSMSIRCTVTEAIDENTAHPAVIKSGIISLGTTWTPTGDQQRWGQTVTVTGASVTANSMITLLPTEDQVYQMISDGLSAILVRNNDGVLTALTVYGTTSVAMDIACTVTEVY